MNKSIIFNLTTLTTALFLISCRPTTTDISICDENTTPLNETLLDSGNYEFSLLGEVLATVEIDSKNKGKFSFKGKAHPTTVSFCTDQSKNKFISFACEFEPGQLTHLGFRINGDSINSSSKELATTLINSQKLLDLQLEFPEVIFSNDKSRQTVYIKTSPNFRKYIRSSLGREAWSVRLEKGENLSVQKAVDSSCAGDFSRLQ